MKTIFAALLFAFAACDVGTIEHGIDEPETASFLAAPAPLANGTPVTGLAASRGANLVYSIDVPAGASALKFQISGGTGDADLYVRFGAPPTTTAWDFRPYLDGNNESVAPPSATAGTWYVMVRAYATFANVTLVASYSTTPPPPPPPGPDCTNADTWPAEWVAFEDGVFELVNQRRAAGATCGGVAYPPAPPLTLDTHLRQAARCHSLDMATHDYFSHTSQDGRSPWDRIAAAGYTGFGNAENIAAGQANAASVMDTWMNSAGHCTNIMSTSSNEIGIGYAYDASADYDRYWTQDFGER
ncbi:MAG TPA: CAP domain-containing protein [Kofleriaceae bacterium]|nr:CAP domain-containing protein [Kofleriaceae bacterium]